MAFYPSLPYFVACSTTTDPFLSQKEVYESPSIDERDANHDIHTTPKTDHDIHTTPETYQEKKITDEPKEKEFPETINSAPKPIATDIIIDTVFFVQTHVHQTSDLYFSLVGKRDTLIKVHLLSPSGESAATLSNDRSMPSRSQKSNCQGRPSHKN